MRRLVALLLGLLLTAGCGFGDGFGGMEDLPLPGSPDVGDDSYTVTADFEDVLNLAVRSTVRLDGVTVGRVETIARDGWQARVTLRLRGDVPLPREVRARVAQTSLLGEKYVDLRVPTGGGTGRLADGDHLDSSATSRGREVEEVLGALSLLLNGGGLGQLRTITTEMQTALGDDASVRQFLDELDSFVTTLDRSRGQIVRALRGVDRLTGQIARDRATVTAALDEITPAVRTLASQRRQLVRMTRRLDEFSRTGTAVIRQSGDDLRADLAALEPVLAQLDRAGADVPRVLETVLSFPFPDEVLDAVEGDYVNLDVLVDLTPTTILGNAIGDDERLGGLLDLLPAIPGLTGGGR